MGGDSYLFVASNHMFIAKIWRVGRNSSLLLGLLARRPGVALLPRPGASHQIWSQFLHSAFDGFQDDPFNSNSGSSASK
ncbi:hypothetical protein MLD38_008637 [Melastoma candidum]|uniref:Uncharacterized protein n=1 Tax=Melastoma candidum TaxID=119954 RepID=A0ACB9RUY0_9MYRT|nr:hypothetical protein MLD38_008637 [Melastoma candidum]